MAKSVMALSPPLSSFFLSFRATSAPSAAAAATATATNLDLRQPGCSLAKTVRQSQAVPRQVEGMHPFQWPSKLRWCSSSAL